MCCAAMPLLLLLLLLPVASAAYRHLLLCQSNSFCQGLPMLSTGVWVHCIHQRTASQRRAQYAMSPELTGLSTWLIATQS
jgi:hypothetical protein